MAPIRQDAGPSRATLLLVSLAIAAVTLAAFCGALSAGLVDWDDWALLRDNPSFRGLSPQHIRWMFSTTLLGHYQPLTWLTFAIDWSIAGLNPQQFHLTSVLLHALNAALLFVFLVRLTAIGIPGGP